MLRTAGGIAIFFMAISAIGGAAVFSINDQDISDDTKVTLLIAGLASGAFWLMVALFLIGLAAELDAIRGALRNDKGIPTSTPSVLPPPPGGSGSEL